MLTKEEYSKACTDMQQIWKDELTLLEACSVQCLINGDTKSIENGKARAKEYQVIQAVVEKCINIISNKYTDWSKDGKKAV